jgi:hypothetical protein
MLPNYKLTCVHLIYFFIFLKKKEKKKKERKKATPLGTSGDSGRRKKIMICKLLRILKAVLPGSSLVSTFIVIFSLFIYLLFWFWGDHDLLCFMDFYSLCSSVPTLS